MLINSFDEANILFFSEMDLPTKEKYMRLKMANDFEIRIKKFIQKQAEVAQNKKLSKAEILFALGLFTVPLIKQYRAFSSRYYESYVSLISQKSRGNFNADNWIKQHSVDFSNWIQETTAENFDKDFVYSDQRINDIAKTETNSLCELATLDGYYREGYKKKQWVSFIDKKTRDSHKVANGQIVPLDEPFSVGNSLLMFPQDSSLGASAKEIVNCRCIMRPVR